jgi:large subunit ribosomal protein L9
MKVILKQSVPKVGKENQVVTVADGYARNFLFPRGLAIVADKNQIKALDIRKQRMAAKVAETTAAAQALKEKLDGQTVKIEGKVGRDAGKLFGAITAQDVADAVASQLGTTLEKRQVALHQPIKRLGHFPVMLDLHPEVDANIDVHVFDPNAPEEPVAVAAETTEEATEETVEE